MVSRRDPKPGPECLRVSAYGKLTVDVLRLSVQRVVIDLFVVDTALGFGVSMSSRIRVSVIQDQSGSHSPIFLATSNSYLLQSVSTIDGLLDPQCAYHLKPLVSKSAYPYRLKQKNLGLCSLDV